MVIQDLLKQAGTNMTVFKSIAKAHHVLLSYYNIVVSISGGSDSDIVLDLIHNVAKCMGKENNITYVWFDTGLEFDATKNHIKYLEDRYGIEIKREKAVKPIPTTCREYGQPFLNKRVSDYIYRLQAHGFQFEDEPFEDLLAKYPKCRSALKWWCNKYNKEDSPLGIAHNKYLKEFLVANPPQFRIANKCCEYSKKKVLHKALDRYDADLNVFGVRKAEGGARQTVYKNCYTDNGSECSTFRPIFWYKDEDKHFYEQQFGIVHSDCYTKYGMRRTGCSGCPFAKDLQSELDIIERYEPKLHKAVSNIFKDSYEYTKQYREFCNKMSQEGKPTSIKLFDI